ncbi:MAG: 4Fe-4S ferredoxin [Desulfobacterales bacterium]|nr:4Fe-4S ferredoxin [Desulfobacterales bacterium]MCP4162570.1 4Fe-4S ferredoxin [Deltaproteobacteria bacterium]
MEAYTEKIREISERLLKDGTVEAVIGYRKGSVENSNEPCIVRSSEKINDLVWDSNCRINLANYLTNRKDKVAIIAKGCDSRNINTQIIENKIKRDQLFIIGVPCSGMTKKEDSSDLQENCKVCHHKNPVVYDELVAAEVEETKVDRYEDVKKIEAMGVEEKWEFFKDLLEPCTRCYACKNACPLCYCPTCFVDESKPQWVGKGMDPIDVRTYHFLRAYHCAGRCTDCGACESACPQGINMRHFTKKLEKECFDQFAWEAGLNSEERPPLDTFKLDDPQTFIK